MTSNIVDANPKNTQPFEFNWVSVCFFAVVHALALLAPWFFSWALPNGEMN
ncbi:hypothetical protein H6F51_11125 [Cyanobacteria bacterium FACHB-DQ100]|nr:hypothetical protein [Cyanobacteria bacterium FACHB-DQ100]